MHGAVTSEALTKGVSIQDILNTADWSTDSTFRRFYPSKENSFVDKLLSFQIRIMVRYIGVFHH